MTFRKSSLLVLLATTQPDVAFSFSPPNNHPSTAQLLHTATTTTTKLNAMERLHRDPSTLNTYGSIEHVYSLQDIDTITQHITDDEWTALGSVIAETMLEMILDVGEDGLMERGWVERTVLANRIAEDVSSVVEKELHKLRSQSSNAFEHYGHEVLPQELLTSLQTLLRHELDAIINLATDRKKPIFFCYRLRLRQTRSIPPRPLRDKRCNRILLQRIQHASSVLQFKSRDGTSHCETPSRTSPPTFERIRNRSRRRG